MLAEAHHLQFAAWLKRFSRWGGWFVIFVGAMVLLGWSIENETLKRVLPGMVAMNPFTAIGFILAGASLSRYWKNREKKQPDSSAGRMMAAAVFVMGALKLAQYLTGWHYSFDQLLFHEQILADKTGRINQMAPNTAFNFALTGVILWFLHAPVRHFSRWAQNLSLALGFISLVPLVGYLYRANYLYSIGSYIPMALHTALGFFLIANGLLLTQTDFGVVSLFTSKTPGGSVARRLVPFALAVPILLGALTLGGVRGGLYTAELAVTIVVVGSAAVLTSLVWCNARLINRADHRRIMAEMELQKAHDRLEERVMERTAELNEVNVALHLQIDELHRAEEKISDQAELLNKAQDAILVVDMHGRILFWNNGAERLYGWASGDVIGKRAGELLMENPSQFTATCGIVLESGQWMGEFRQKLSDNNTAIVESHWTLVKNKDGKPRSMLIINTDITEKKNYESQILRAQRMESIGALASGIAHDLNNALTPVVMGAQLLRQNHNEEERGKLLDMISLSAQRSTEMVRQILSFARGGGGQFGSVDFARLVADMQKIARDTFPRSITIHTDMEERLWNVRGDATELHQVLLNLCVNARDAMPGGGQLSILARNVILGADDIPSGSESKPGPYIAVVVADTGSGIPQEVLPRIFEPFFTTKMPDKGTGLGLSTVAAIIKHHNGFVKIDSRVGKGTKFKIHLPATKTAVNQPLPDDVAARPGHGELILVMDDEEAIRELEKNTLESYGYRVLTAANGLEGLASFEKHRDEIRLLLTDTDMPFMDGITALHSMQEMRPDLPVIIASGARRDASQLWRIDMTRLTTLTKPYTAAQLLTAVASVINTHGAEAD